MWCNGRWGRRWRRRWGVLWVVASLVTPTAMGVVGVVIGDGDVSSVHGGGLLWVMLRVAAPLATLMMVRAAVVGPVCAAWWWWLWLDCSVVVVSVGGPDDGPWVCGCGWACMVVLMVCHCGWCWVWYRLACGLR